MDNLGLRYLYHAYYIISNMLLMTHSLSSAGYQELCRPSENVTSLNECRILLNLCANGVCIDTPDGYRCDCNTGFTPDPSGQRCLGR